MVEIIEIMGAGIHGPCLPGSALAWMGAVPRKATKESLPTRLVTSEGVRR